MKFYELSSISQAQTDKWVLPLGIDRATLLVCGYWTHIYFILLRVLSIVNRMPDGNRH